ncbi:unnamed protein product [Paramecium sonneborni]|uniref:Transmembrane protein n=1 Tax=Paramecium sonneborni TaxID=65129 RepID=A0A8S1K0I3_9CILI|nr:unnamed protein product [Paramecium sonneborni]
MQSAVVYITLPGETISLKSMISGNTIKTNKQDINITKQLEIETLHVGWFWVDQQKIAICHNPIYYQPEINDYVIVQVTVRIVNIIFVNLVMVLFIIQIKWILKEQQKRINQIFKLDNFYFQESLNLITIQKANYHIQILKVKKNGLQEKIYFENCQGVLLWNYLSTLYKVFQVLKLSLNYLKKQVNILVLKFVLVRMVESGLKGLMLF